MNNESTKPYDKTNNWTFFLSCACFIKGLAHITRKPQSLHNSGYQKLVFVLSCIFNTLALMACLFLGGCGSSPDSASVGASAAIGTLTNSVNNLSVPDLTLLAKDGSRLVVVGTVDARCHPQGREPQVAAVGATSGQEEE